jgi:hypothetical protein
MKQSQHFLENAENCAQLAERATEEPTHNRYKRMEAAWRALAEEQDWLDGEVSPAPLKTTSTAGDKRERQKSDADVRPPAG